MPSSWGDQSVLVQVMVLVVAVSSLRGETIGVVAQATGGSVSDADGVAW